MGKSNGYDHEFPSVSSGGASVVQVHNIGRGGAVALWFSAFIASVGLLTGIWAIRETSLLEREVRIAQDELMRFRARLETQGISTSDGDH